MDYCANTFRRKLISRDGAQTISRQSPTLSTRDHGNDSNGEPPLKPGTNTYDQFNSNVLLRPVEYAQYTSTGFAEFARKNAIRTSVGRTGVCWDNAAAESWFATLKNEMYYQQSFQTRSRARCAVAEYIEVFYNRQRLHSTLGYRPPIEAFNEYRQAAAAA